MSIQLPQTVLLFIVFLGPTLISEPATQQRPMVVICCGPQESYRDASAALMEALKAKSMDCLIIELPGKLDQSSRDSVLKKIRDASPVLIATGGLEATMLVLDEVPAIPVVFFMVPNARDAIKIREVSPAGRLSGVTSDISPMEWVTWIREVQPNGRSVGILFSDRSRRTAEGIVEAAKTLDLSVRLIEADSENFPGAISSLAAAKCDSVLMIPDARVYNGPNIQRLLLWGIRTKTPIWAFSHKIVRAGAPSGVYASSLEVGRQAAELVWRISKGADAGQIGVEYPKKTTRALNERTVEMIGLKLSGRAREMVNERIGEVP